MCPVNSKAPARTCPTPCPNLRESAPPHLFHPIFAIFFLKNNTDLIGQVSHKQLRVWRELVYGEFLKCASQFRGGITKMDDMKKVSMTLAKRIF